LGLNPAARYLFPATGKEATQILEKCGDSTPIAASYTPGISLSEIDLTQPTINDLQAIAD
jgi:hypothetical protein